jgi:hypothetical protein
MLIILILLVLLLIYWIYYRSRPEKFTIIKSDPQNAYLEKTANNVFEKTDTGYFESHYTPHFIEGKMNNMNEKDMNERMMEKNIELGKNVINANRGAQKSRVDYFRKIFGEELDENEKRDWWEKHTDSSSFFS